MNDECEIVNNILDELMKAESKFPEFVYDPIHAVAILSEESGEATQAALNWVYHKGDPNLLKEELYQTAAMCIRILKNFDRFQLIQTCKV